MAKIKPFVWGELSSFWYSENEFGSYFIDFLDSQYRVAYQDQFLENCSTIELAKRFAFDDFKRRLEETLGEPVGYDLPIDENC